MTQGVIDLTNIISGSSNIGYWKFDNTKYKFSLSESSPYEVRWISNTPEGVIEVENRISMLADHFFANCES